MFFAPLEGGPARGTGGLLCGGGVLVLVQPVEGLLRRLHLRGQLCGLRGAVEGERWVHRAGLSKLLSLLILPSQQRRMLKGKIS